MKTSAHMIGKICLMDHPEAKNEIEAVAIKEKELRGIIDRKIQINLPAADDIELYFTVCSAKTELSKRA